MDRHTIRQNNPDRTFETRSLPFPDGISRLITLEDWYWNKLAIIIEKGERDELGIIEFCYQIATENRPKDHPDFERQLRLIFAYYIRRFYQGYLRFCRGHANDNYWPEISQ